MRRVLLPTVSKPIFWSKSAMIAYCNWMAESNKMSTYAYEIEDEANCANFLFDDVCLWDEYEA